MSGSRNRLKYSPGFSILASSRECVNCAMGLWKGSPLAYLLACTWSISFYYKRPERKSRQANSRRCSLPVRVFVHSFRLWLNAICSWLPSTLLLLLQDAYQNLLLLCSSSPPSEYTEDPSIFYFRPLFLFITRWQHRKKLANPYSFSHFSILSQSCILVLSINCAFFVVFFYCFLSHYIC